MVSLSVSEQLHCQFLKEYTDFTALKGLYKLPKWCLYRVKQEMYFRIQFGEFQLFFEKYKKQNNYLQIDKTRTCRHLRIF